MIENQGFRTYAGAHATPVGHGNRRSTVVGLVGRRQPANGQRPSNNGAGAAGSCQGVIDSDTATEAQARQRQGLRTGADILVRHTGAAAEAAGCKAAGAITTDQIGSGQGVGREGGGAIVGTTAVERQSKLVDGSGNGSACQCIVGIAQNHGVAAEAAIATGILAGNTSAAAGDGRGCFTASHAREDKSRSEAGTSVIGLGDCCGQCKRRYRAGAVALKGDCVVEPAVTIADGRGVECHHFVGSTGILIGKTDDGGSHLVATD